MAHRSTPRLSAVCFLLAACASEPTPPAEYAPREAPPAATAATEPEAPAAPVAEAPPAPPPAPPVQIVAGEHTPIEGAAPTLKIRAPRNGQLIKTDRVEVSLALQTWPLSPQGNHVHLIVDNEPYIAIRDTEKPIDLRALLQKELGHDLSEGSHTLRVFPSRGHHESVKEAGAFDLITFHFKKKSEGFAFDVKAPLLTYSRPKGCVTLGERALLDFYVANAKLGADAYRVRVSIDATEEGDIVAWTPHYIENLAEGEHSLRLWLVNEKGEPAPGLWNDTTRTIRVQADCKAPAPAAPPPSAASPTAPAPTESAPAAPQPAGN